MEATLIFPHQLFSSHPAVARNRKILIFQDPIFINDHIYKSKFHKSKILLHLLSTKEFHKSLLNKKYSSELIGINDIKSNNYLEDIFKRYNVSKIHFCDVVDFILHKRIMTACKNRAVKVCIYDSPGFYLSRAMVEKDFSNKNSHFMASFYKKQRQRYNILMNHDGTPSGGKWSFDHENRKRFPKDMIPPSEIKLAYSDSEIISSKLYIEKNYNSNPGNFDSFNFPINRDQAVKSFHYFLENKLKNFGAYEDAIVKNELFLFHSIVTPYLNIGLMTPKEIISDTLDYANQNSIPINSLEGFIRQIIGWREFMRGIYVIDGVKQRNSNFWNYEKDIPNEFYTASTGIEPLDNTIRKCLDNAYVHHIERLMVLGNLMLLLEINPNSVYKWFMEFFIDSYDWVMVPNVYGMSQFSDGGLLATKPYISGSNYILKMSDYKRGDWCKVWDALYWRFINKNRSFFKKNPRMNMMVSMYDKKDEDTRLALNKTVEEYCSKLFT